jgi:hypothetical protein
MGLLMNRVIPDLLYYTEQYIINSTANKYKIPFPASFPNTYLLTNNSFIRLLFDENWPSTLTTYRYLYREETDRINIPETILRRMMIYPDETKYYVCDSDSTSICSVNVFNLQQDDLTLLDLLLKYKTDTTSIIDISIIDPSGLVTHLSELIYVYLNFKINNDYADFDNLNVISSNTEVLENFYESFLVDILFTSISNLGT